MQSVTKATTFSLWGVGFDSNMLQYCVFELLVASEAVKMNKIPSKHPWNWFKYRILWIDYWETDNVPQLDNFSAFLALRQEVLDK